MVKIHEIAGGKYNRLTILRSAGRQGSNRLVEAICDCGTIKNYRLSRVKTGETRSCGCLADELTSERSKTHGLKKHPLYMIWTNMRRRCNNPELEMYKNYGAKGVRVCKEWDKDFKAFYDWCMANGWREGLQIDKDKKAPNKQGKLYSPEYCSILTVKENCKYRKSTRWFTFNGITNSLIEWCESLKLSYHKTRARLYSGWSFEEAITIP